MNHTIPHNTAQTITCPYCGKKHEKIVSVNENCVDCQEYFNGETLNPDKEYFVKRMMEHINNPQPLKKRPFACPGSAYQKNNNCQYPNCLCEWKL